jgi:hypothetical protein
MLRRATSLTSRPSRRVIGATLAASALGLAIAPVASAATRPHKTLTPLQQGMAFYKGKVITLISPDAPGGGFDTVARVVAPFIGQYLGATVNVTNDSPANTIAGQDLFVASPADGLTVGMVNPGPDIEDAVTGTPGVNFNPEKLQFLGGNNPNAGNGFTCLASSPYKTFADVVHAPASSPVSEVIVSTGTQTLNLDLTNAAFGINARVIGGYTSTSNEVAGLERGDGNCSSVGINTGGFGPYIAAGKANVLLDDFVPNPATAYYSYVQNAMTLPQAYKAFPATTKNESLARVALTQVTGTGIGHEFNLQPRVASYKVAAMRAAVKYALTNIQCEDKLLAAGQQNGYIDGPRGLADYKTEYAALKKVSGIIKTALGV